MVDGRLFGSCIVCTIGLKILKFARAPKKTPGGRVPSEGYTPSSATEVAPMKRCLFTITKTKAIKIYLYVHTQLTQRQRKETSHLHDKKQKQPTIKRVIV